MNDVQLSQELEVAARQAIAARARVDRTPAHSAAYQAALIDYLQATVLHLSIVSVAQARQHEWLVAEVEDLKEALGTERVAVH